MTTLRFTVSLLALVLFLLAASCRGTERNPVSTEESIRAIATTMGDLLLQTSGTRFIRDEAPELMPVLDTNGDGIITLGELESLRLENAQTRTAVMQLLFQLADELEGRKAEGAGK